VQKLAQRAQFVCKCLTNDKFRVTENTRQKGTCDATRVCNPSSSTSIRDLFHVHQPVSGYQTTFSKYPIGCLDDRFKQRGQKIRHAFAKEFHCSCKILSVPAPCGVGRPHSRGQYWKGPCQRLCDRGIQHFVRPEANTQRMSFKRRTSNSV
jgi:hypothetical protein